MLIVQTRLLVILSTGPLPPMYIRGLGKVRTNRFQLFLKVALAAPSFWLAQCDVQ